MNLPTLVTENNQAFIDKVFEMASAKGLPSKGYESALSGFTDDNIKKYLSKVRHCDYPLT